MDTDHDDGDKKDTQLELTNKLNRVGSVSQEDNNTGEEANDQQGE